MTGHVPCENLSLITRINSNIEYTKNGYVCSFTSYWVLNLDIPSDCCSILSCFLPRLRRYSIMIVLVLLMAAFFLKVCLTSCSVSGVLPLHASMNPRYSFNTSLCSWLRLIMAQLSVNFSKPEQLLRQVFSWGAMAIG